ncbi:MAG: CPBP family intramembrane glutamic endopeptidase [Nannocystaceae bacterium]
MRPRTLPTPSAAGGGLIDGVASAAVFAAFVVAAVLGPPGWPAAAVAVVAAIGLLATGATRPQTRLAALLLATLASTATVLPPIWPIGQVLWVLAVAVAVWGSPALRWPGGWWPRGRLRVGWIAVLAGAPVIALTLWATATSPARPELAALLADRPLPLLVAAGLGFAIVNAILEELAFRSALQGAWTVALGSSRVAIVAQGVAFGVAHWRGVPDGPIGALLAGAWGIALGVARQQTGGLATPIVGHVVADLVIFAIVARGALFGP